MRMYGEMKEFRTDEQGMLNVEVKESNKRSNPAPL